MLRLFRALLQPFTGRLTSIGSMDRAHLAKLYRTSEFSDCVVVPAQKQKFNAHRSVISQYPHLTELLDEDHCIHLAESTEVTERLLRWIYGVEWPEINVQPTRVDVGKELMDIMSLCEAAQKYEISKLGDDAYGAVGEVLSQITTAEVGLHVLRDLTDKETSAGALQRTLIDRILSLLPRDTAGAGTKRKRSVSVSHVLKDEDTDDAEADAVSDRPERVKKPTAKAKESKTPKKPAGKSSSTKSSTSAEKSSINLHCVCKKPEDPYLVQCEYCERWFHPGCIGKGKYGDGTYRHARKVARSGDEKMYREENLMFTCNTCDEKHAKQRFALGQAFNK